MVPHCLAGAELEQLSHRSGWGRWSLISSLANYLVNNLQLSVHHVHIRFVSPPTARTPHGAHLGMHCDRIATTLATDSSGLPASLLRMVGRGAHGAPAARIQREIEVRGWQLYLDPDPPAADSTGGPTPAPRGSPQGVQQRRAGLSPGTHSGSIICPVDVALRVAVREGPLSSTVAQGQEAAQVKLELLTVVEVVSLQVRGGAHPVGHQITYKFTVQYN